MSATTSRDRPPAPPDPEHDAGSAAPSTWRWPTWPRVVDPSARWSSATGRLATGVNRVTRDLDPTAHAEVVAIRAACAATGEFQLTGATLYASCEPCPLCLAASMWARLDAVVHAADRHAAAGAGFDDATFHGALRVEPRGWPSRCATCRSPPPSAPSTRGGHTPPGSPIDAAQHNGHVTEPLSPADHLVELVGATALLSAAAASFGDEAPAAPVPTCPGWTVEQLVAHVGGVHRWAAAAARGTTSPGRAPQWDRGLPLVEWYVAGAGELLATLAAADPEAPAWTFSRAPGTTAFWRRRQLHEATIHGADILFAGEEDVTEVEEIIDSRLAVDGVDEVLTTFLQRGIDRGEPDDPLHLVPAPRPIALRATDVELDDGGTGTAAWTVQVVDGTVRTQRLGDGDEADVAATITAPAARLYLALWGRADREA